MRERSISDVISKSLFDYLSGNEGMYPRKEETSRAFNPQMMHEMINMATPIGETVAPFMKEMKAGLGHLMNPKYANLLMPAIKEEAFIGNIEDAENMMHNFFGQGVVGAKVHNMPEYVDPYMPKFEKSLKEYIEKITPLKQNLPEHERLGSKKKLIFSDLFNSSLSEKKINSLLKSYRNYLKESMHNYNFAEEGSLSKMIEEERVNSNKKRIDHLLELLNELKGEKS